MSSEPESFSGLSLEGHLQVSEVLARHFREAETHLAEHVDPETIPEPARSHVIALIDKLKQRIRMYEIGVRSQEDNFNPSQEDADTFLRYLNEMKDNND